MRASDDQSSETRLVINEAFQPGNTKSEGRILKGRHIFSLFFNNCIFYFISITNNSTLDNLL